MYGHKCITCRAEYNAISPPCPNCHSWEAHKLTQLVPFSKESGVPPDYVYYCICGKIFQCPRPDNFDVFTKDKEALKEIVLAKCPFCGRHNDHANNWYIPE